MKFQPAELFGSSQIFHYNCAEFQWVNPLRKTTHSTTWTKIEEMMIIHHLYTIFWLCYFAEGRCLLELTHKSNQEGSENWVPIAKKVYWPPPGPVKAESSPSVQSGKNLTFYQTSFSNQQLSVSLSVTKNDLPETAVTDYQSY